jgi:hypothetical protein
LYEILLQGCDLSPLQKFSSAVRHGTSSMPEQQMQELLSIFDANDLLTAEGVARFFRGRSFDEVSTLVRGLRKAMNSQPRLAIPGHPSPLDEANFLPSASLRGSSGCADWECRLGKIDVLARYAALYCDKAIVPIKLRLPDAKSHSPAGPLSPYYHLEGSLLSVIRLRPLIEADLVLLVPEDLHFCEKHWDQAVPEHKEISRAARRLANRNLRNFCVTYEHRSALGRPFLSFQGPDRFLEHGSIIRTLNNVPSWIPKRKVASLKLSQDLLRKHGVVLQLFQGMANDAILQSYFGSAFNARYVTSLPGEIEFFSLLNERDELARQTSALCARLTHTVPMLTDIPIEGVLRLRREEPEAFSNYRSALTDIVKTYVSSRKSVGDAEAKDIYTDLLKPQLDLLQAKAKNTRSNQVKKSMLKVAASSALVGLGIYGGVLPANLGELVKMIGGFNVAKDLAEALGAIEKNPLEVRNHNLYFLLRLRQEADR